MNLYIVELLCIDPFGNFVEAQIGVECSNSGIAGIGALKECEKLSFDPIAIIAIREANEFEKYLTQGDDNGEI